jgi:hypothetical protein
VAKRWMVPFAVTGLLAAALGFAPAGAAPVPSAITLDAFGSVSWQGTTFSNASTPSPEACALDATDAAQTATGQPLCDVLALRVQAGQQFWESHPDATVQVGIQWKDFEAAESESEYDDFDLYVYDGNGQLVASSVGGRSSSGIASSAQVVDIPRPAVGIPEVNQDGNYEIVVVPANVQNRGYHGLAMLQTNEPAHGGALLPELQALQPSNFRTAIGTYSLSRVNTDLRSCYIEETIEDVGNPTTCLRFDAGHSNTGDGALLFEIDLSTAHATTDDQGRPALGGYVMQLIDGSTQGPIPVGSYVFHPNHAHIHFKAFARYGLYAVNANGSRGAEIVPSKKSDFCMIDVDDLWFGRAGNQPRTHHFPQCNTFDEASADASRIVQHQGINRGWADIYTWDLPGQYIDISSVGTGTYDIVNTVNPDGAIAEIDKTNNEAATRIHLTVDQSGAVTVTCIAEPYGCPPGA